MKLRCKFLHPERYFLHYRDWEWNVKCNSKFHHNSLTCRPRTFAVESNRVPTNQYEFIINNYIIPDIMKNEVLKNEKSYPDAVREIWPINNFSIGWIMQYVGYDGAWSYVFAQSDFEFFGTSSERSPNLQQKYKLANKQQAENNGVKNVIHTCCLYRAELWHSAETPIQKQLIQPYRFSEFK